MWGANEFNVGVEGSMGRIRGEHIETVKDPVGVARLSEVNLL